MKKGFIAAILAILCLALPVSAANSTISVILDGKAISFDQPPIEQKGRTLIPVRAVSEALQARVDWDEATQTVTVTKDDTTISLILNSRVAGVDREYTEIKILDVPATEINGRTLVPLRFLAESLGLGVGWDEATQTVTLTSGAYKPEPVDTSGIQCYPDFPDVPMLENIAGVPGYQERITEGDSTFFYYVIDGDLSEDEGSDYFDLMIKKGFHVQSGGTTGDGEYVIFCFNPDAKINVSIFDMQFGDYFCSVIEIIHPSRYHPANTGAADVPFRAFADEAPPVSSDPATQAYYAQMDFMLQMEECANNYLNAYDSLNLLYSQRIQNANTSRAASSATEALTYCKTLMDDMKAQLNVMVLPDDLRKHFSDNLVLLNDCYSLSNNLINALTTNTSGRLTNDQQEIASETLSLIYQSADYVRRDAINGYNIWYENMPN